MEIEERKHFPRKKLSRNVFSKINQAEIHLSHGRTCALLNSVQKFIKIQGWLLLTFFTCLHNQLNSFNSIIVQMSEKRVHQIGSKNEWLLFE